MDPSADPEKDEALATRGRILGGGVALKSRPLGLVINHQNKSVRVSQDIATSINRRFHTFVDGRKQGVATPKTDEFIDLLMHPRYKDNIARYIELVHNVAINELPAERQARLLVPGATAGRSAHRRQCGHAAGGHRRR